MVWRIAARALTGPAAFLVGGVIDALTYLAASARRRWGDEDSERSAPETSVTPARHGDGGSNRR